MWRSLVFLVLALPISAWGLDEDELVVSPDAGRRLDLASFAKGLGPDPAAALPNTSMEVVSGLVEAFLHKEQMPEEERQCIVNGTSELAGNIMRVASHTVMLTQAVLGVRDEPPPPMPESTAESRFPESREEAKTKELQRSGALVERRRLQGGALGVALGASQLFIDLGVSLQKIALLSHRIMKDCIQGEAREALQRASEHMRNVQYISGHFLANGADIVSEIGDGMDNWNSGHYREFGRSVGTALRKAVLGNASSSGFVPEGPPDGQVLGNITVGLADGLLGKGFSLEVSMIDRPEADLHIDLRTCVGKNLFFFQSAWSATMYFFAQQAAQTRADEHRYKEVKHRFGQQLAFTMMQLPQALKTCNINQVQEHAILDAVRAFGTGMSIHFHVPGGHHMGLPQVEAVIKEAIEHWKKSRWYSFGYDIGKLLQLMVLTVFPQKYSVDARGSLRQQLAEVEDSGPSDEPLDNSGVFIAIPAICLLMVAIFIAAGRRTLLLARLAAAQLPNPRNSMEQPAPALPGRDVEAPGQVAGIE